MHTKTVILLENFSFGLNNCVYFSSTFFIQRLLASFLLFSLIKKRVFNDFYSWGQRYLHLWFFKDMTIVNRCRIVLYTKFSETIQKSPVLFVSPIRNGE